MSTHTPGPWRLNWHVAGGGQHSTYPVLHYVSIEGGEYGDDEQEQPLRITGYIRKPDAYLLGAAPELLATLKLVRKLWAKDDSCIEIDAIDAAIAKAEGRS